MGEDRRPCPRRSEIADWGVDFEPARPQNPHCLTKQRCPGLNGDTAFRLLHFECSQRTSDRNCTLSAEPAPTLAREQEPHVDKVLQLAAGARPAYHPLSLRILTYSVVFGKGVSEVWL